MMLLIFICDEILLLCTNGGIADEVSTGGEDAADDGECIIVGGEVVRGVLVGRSDGDEGEGVRVNDGTFGDGE